MPDDQSHCMFFLLEKLQHEVVLLAETGLTMFNPCKRWKFIQKIEGKNNCAPSMPSVGWLRNLRTIMKTITSINDNNMIMKTITFGIKNGPCETLPFFPCLSLCFPFPVSSFTLPFPSPFLFPVLFPFLLPFLFRFLFCSFSFRVPFLLISFVCSFPSPFPCPFPFPFPFLFLSFSYSFLSLLLFLAHVNSLMWSQRLEKP